MDTIKKEIQGEEKYVEGMYTTLSKAKEEIWRRWNDKELRRKVEEYLGEIPEVFQKEPRAILARHVATPNKEFYYFQDVAKMLGIRPLIWEYHKDKFFTVNQDKLFLGKLHFYDCGKNGDASVLSRKVVDFKNIEGKSICDIKTKDGGSLIEFHRELIRHANFADIETCDASDWYRSRGNNAKENYKYFLSLFLFSGILFENFLENENEKKFTNEVVIPAFKEIKELFGVSPLIVPIVPKLDEKEIHWWCYDSEMTAFVDSKLFNK